MKIFILVVILYGNTYMAQTEFASEAKCLAARLQIIQSKTGSAFCFEK